MSVYLSVPEGLEPELLRQLARVHGVGQVLLVGEDQESSVAQLIFLQLESKLKTVLEITIASVQGRGSRAA